MSIAISRPSAGTVTMREKIELNNETRTWAAPGGNPSSVTRPSLSVRSPHDAARAGTIVGGHGCGDDGLSGDADTIRPASGPSGQVSLNVARPPATTRTRDSPRPATGTSCESVSCTLLQRLAVRVHTR